LQPIQLHLEFFRVESSDAIEQWVEDTLHNRPAITPKELQTKILTPRYQDIRKKAEALGKLFRLKSFQRKAPRFGDRVLLLSGCGSGKTIFGYKWHQAMLSKYDVGHVIFLYPTRGTATEGFKDYVAWVPEAKDASLLTGTALYELKALSENPTESTKDKDFTTEERLFALGFWDRRFFSATVDQFLSFLTHSYSSICLLPVLADSVVVIDEVHSFSYKMFGNLISFLEHFDIPVLCMTATLPKRRRERLEKFLKIFPAASDAELKEIEERPRYIVEEPLLKTEDRDLASVHQEGLRTAYDLAIAAYREAKLVLWVVNTVDRCREIAIGNQELRGLVNEIGDDNVLTYHSRFTLDDRKERHRETVEGFAFSHGKRKPFIAVTTQVCEMSLDLDADVLITELAPISSLIQRFGRSNRSPEREADFRSQVFVYEPANILPYEVSELEAARKFITKVTGEVSQAKLAIELENYSLSERKPDESSFITGGYWATSEPFRGDEENYTANAFLKKDLEAIAALIEENKRRKKEGKKQEPIDGYVLSVPKRLAIWEGRPEWMLRNMRYMAIADDSLYCPKRGFGK
jgi:CRISPR-associated endonuclease/helicase Cas3